MTGQANLVFLVVLIAAFYLLIIRPQQVRHKQQNAMIAALKPGDRIVTIGGIYGTIVRVDAESIVVRIASGVEIELAKQAVGRVEQAGSAPLDEKSLTPGDDGGDA